MLALRRRYPEDLGTYYDLTITPTGAVSYRRGFGALPTGRAHLEPFELRRLVEAFEAARFDRLPVLVNAICGAEEATLRLFRHEVTWFGRDRPETAVLERLESMILEVLGMASTR